jgi:hypothetical protein
MAYVQIGYVMGKKKFGHVLIAFRPHCILSINWFIGEKVPHAVEL